MLKADLWKWLYPRWRTRAGDLQPGYTLLMLLPADLPFFFDIWARIFADKRTDHLVETLVIPDQLAPGLQARYDRFAASWPHGPLRMVPLRPLDRFLAARLKNPHQNCWLQLINAVEATRSTHAIWHDADLFISSPDFLEAHYGRCSREHLACLGVSPAWDPWYAEHGLDHVTATWELAFDVDWIRQTAPWEHRGHEATILGQRHVADITFLAQSRTDPGRISRDEWQVEHFVHFNYVMGSYRFFQTSRGPFEDDHFRILLVRLLIDAYDPGDYPYDAPTAVELARGIADPANRVTYTGPKTSANYVEFRAKLARFLDGPFLDPRQADIVRAGVRPFDLAFGAPASP